MGRGRGCNRGTCPQFFTGKRMRGNDTDRMGQNRGLYGRPAAQGAVVGVVVIPEALAAGGAATARSVKAYAALAAAGWPTGLTVQDVARLAGMSWVTASSALDDLITGQWITTDYQPLEAQ